VLGFWTKILARLCSMESLASRPVLAILETCWTV
jgi:hypothetical protein